MIYCILLMLFMFLISFEEELNEIFKDLFETLRSHLLETRIRRAKRKKDYYKIAFLVLHDGDIIDIYERMLDMYGLSIDEAEKIMKLIFRRYQTFSPRKKDRFLYKNAYWVDTESIFQSYASNDGDTYFWETTLQATYNRHQKDVCHCAQRIYMRIFALILRNCEDDMLLEKYFQMWDSMNYQDNSYECRYIEGEKKRRKTAAKSTTHD